MAMLWPLWFSLLSPTLAQSPTYTPDPLFSDYMSDCYGKNSIYALFQDRMDPHCDEVAGAPVNFTALDECHCESGWLAVKQACEDCENAYGHEFIGNNTALSAECSASGYSIAPVPNSILEAWAGHNETFVPSASSTADRDETSVRATGTTVTGRTTGRSSTRTATGGVTLSGRPDVTSSLAFSFSGLPTINFTVTQNGNPTGDVPDVQRPTSTSRQTGGSARELIKTEYALAWTLVVVVFTI